MTIFTLEKHGDPHEQRANLLFLRDEFPQYEEFWQLFVVELTGRVHDVHDIYFRSQEALDAAGRSGWHVAVAQLHYTTLLHLARVFDVRASRVRDRDSFIEAIVRLNSATETAFELLGHCLLDQGTTDAWDEEKTKEVRKRWQNHAGYPLAPLRHYRNALVHGRVRLEHTLVLQAEDWRTSVSFFPTFGAMPNATDWRTADAAATAPADHLVDEAWSDVLVYLRRAWSVDLIPWAHKAFTAPRVPSASQPLRGSLASARSASADAPPGYQGGSISGSRTVLSPPPDPTD